MVPGFKMGRNEDTLPLVVPRALKYMGRSATMPAQLGVAVLSTLTVAASEMPGPLTEVPRSPSTHSVTRLEAGTLTETVLEPPLPRSGWVRSVIVTWQGV